MENQDKTERNIVDVLASLYLHPTPLDSGSLYIAHCPIDKTHHMTVDSCRNKWECNHCKTGGDILDLMYQECLSHIKTIRDSMAMELKEFNTVAGTNYSLNDLMSINILRDFENEDLGSHMAKIKAIRELFNKTYHSLDQYRLSVINRDLTEGKELNDDIKKWWAQRY